MSALENGEDLTSAGLFRALALLNSSGQRDILQGLLDEVSQDVFALFQHFKESCLEKVFQPLVVQRHLSRLDLRIRLVSDGRTRGHYFLFRGRVWVAGSGSAGRLRSID